MILVLGKARSCRARNLGCGGGLSHLGDLTFCQKTWHTTWCMSWCTVVMKVPNHQLPIAIAFWIIWTVSAEECSNLTQNLLQFIALLSHFECDGYTVHMLTQGHIPPPLTRAMKSPLFMHEHSSPLSLTARLYGCHANHSSYINNGWAFSGQTSYSHEQNSSALMELTFKWGEPVNKQIVTNIYSGRWW